MQINWCRDEKYLDQMARFQVRMAWETEKFELNFETVYRGIETQIKKSDTGRYLLATENDHLVGMLLALNEWSDWRCQNVIWIHSVFILPEFRKMKVFRKMYEMIQAEVNSDDSLAGIRLYVDKSNIPAQKVYQKIGMNDEHYALYEWLK